MFQDLLGRALVGMCLNHANALRPTGAWLPCIDNNLSSHSWHRFAVGMNDEWWSTGPSSKAVIRVDPSSCQVIQLALT